MVHSLNNACSSTQLARGLLASTDSKASVPSAHPMHCRQSTGGAGVLLFTATPAHSGGCLLHQRHSQPAPCNCTSHVLLLIIRPACVKSQLRLAPHLLCPLCALLRAHLPSLSRLESIGSLLTLTASSTPAPVASKTTHRQQITVASDSRPQTQMVWERGIAIPRATVVYWGLRACSG